MTPPRASSSPAQPLTVCRTQRKKRSQRRQISPKMSWWSIFGAVPPQPMGRRPPCILSVLGGAIGRGLGSIILDIFLRSICQVQPEVKSPGGSRIEGRISGCGRPHARRRLAVGDSSGTPFGVRSTIAQTSAVPRPPDGGLCGTAS